MKTSITSFLILSCTLLFPLYLSAQNLAFKKTDEGILLTEENKPRFFYQTATKSLSGKYPRANYVHPLYGLNGEILTEDFPEDHFHHRGIFWTWHQLYVNGKRIADPWFCEGISWKVTNTNTNITDGTARLESTVKWLSDSLNQQAVLEENVIIRYEKLENDVFALTFDITLTALVDELELGGSEDAKGYGGFSPRITLPEDLRFSSNGQPITPQNLPVQAGPWMDLRGSFDGKNLSGIVIMGEPDQLPQYQGWILRSSKSMQNLAFPGKAPIQLTQGKKLRFRNKILVYKNMGKEAIENYYHQFMMSR
ncbi:PmoA family protein [Echinicola sediminis]